MSADLQATEQDDLHHPHPAAEHGDGATEAANDEEQSDEEDEEEEDDDGEDEEPKLKYARLTGSLTNLYRNGDSTSAFTQAGDKMVLGTHNGNIHLLQLPTLHSLKTYHAHSATITSLSVSPTPPPPRSTDASNPAPATTPPSPAPPRTPTPHTTTTTRTPSRTQQAPSIPATPNNAIYIATSSLDGHICISSLLDPKDVQLRNFARPVQTVALSPHYKADRTYLSAGLAGQLILTVGGKAGVTVGANTSSTAAAASGWLGSMGLGGDRGKDTVLHSGEGVIREVKWSLSGKWVVWVNEEGIKIMRSHLHLGSEESEEAWRRIAHAARPNRRAWEEMAGVWRARAEWVDDRCLESDHDVVGLEGEERKEEVVVVVNGTPSAAQKKTKKVEKLVVGWGDTAWILHVSQGGTTPAGKKQIGTADIVHKLQFRDCIVSGITLYTPSLLAILAYRTRDDNDRPILLQQQQQQQQNGGRQGRRQRHRQTGLEPQLRLIDVRGGEEVVLDELSISRFETLSAQDYHLSTLYIPQPKATPATATTEKSGALEGLWDAAGGKYASRMFSSGASMVSRSSSGDRPSIASPPGSTLGVPAASPAKRRRVDAHPYAAEPGLKLLIQSPYDCILAIKRDKSDHLAWLLERKEYARAWELVDSHPEIVGPGDAASGVGTDASQASTPSKAQGSLADFFADDSASQRSGVRAQTSAAEKEKKRIGEQWLQQLVSASRWEEAGAVAGKVLGTSSRWEHWVWTFAQADKFDEITPYIPSTSRARLPGVVYEVILGHYVAANPRRLAELLEEWDPSLDLFDAGSVIKAIEARVGSEDDVDDGGEEWRTLMEALAKLYLADGRAKEALNCWIRTQNAEKAFELIREENLMDVVAPEDVPGLLMLRVSKDMTKSARLSELEDATREAVQLLAGEAHRGSLMPATVIRQLQKKGPNFRPFIFFYLRTLWNGTNRDDDTATHLHRRFDHHRKILDEGHALVEDHADLAVELFSQYDRDLLMTFLRASEVYNYETAAATCERLHYIPELVYVLSKMGQTKRALFLIIGDLGDVKQAIDFTKENPDLWDDLLEYSMDKPQFIRGLLEEVGTAIDPVELVRRIPEGLEIEGLREGVQKMFREYDIQFSISEGVARVLRGEVVVGMETLRAGQRKGVRFEVVTEEGVKIKEVEIRKPAPDKIVDGAEQLPPIRPQSRGQRDEKARPAQPGHCVGCSELFSEDGKSSTRAQSILSSPTDMGDVETEPLIGFACGHVYHLSCLLKANPDTSDPSTIERLLSQLRSSNDDDDGTGYSGRSVGAKVAHAHIIRNVLRGGCPVCGVDS